MPADDAASLDLTSESVDEQEVIDRQELFQQKEYDPRPQEDSARRRIAYILLGLLGIVLLWALVSISVFPLEEDKIVNVLQITLSPLVALVSAATGFYFGSK